MRVVYRKKSVYSEAFIKGFATGFILCAILAWIALQTLIAGF